MLYSLSIKEDPREKQNCQLNSSKPLYRSKEDPRGKLLPSLSVKEDPGGKLLPSLSVKEDPRGKLRLD